MKNRITLLIAVCFFAFAKAQVGINTTTPSNNSVLEIGAQNEDGSFGGLLLPTVTPAELASLATDADAEGLIVFVNDGGTLCLNVYNVSTESWDIVNCLGATSDILISEYVEGSDAGDKYVELYNPTTSSIDLSDYKLIVLRNGNDFPVSGSDLEYTLNGTIAPGGTFIISDDNPTSFTGADQQVTVLNFSGNDPVVLTDLSDNIIDVVGIPGTDPGDGYSVDEADTQNVTLRRNYNILNPNSTWTPSEWSAYPVDDFSNLGQR